MWDLRWLTEAQKMRLEPKFLRSRGNPCAGDRQVLSGSVVLDRNRLRRQDTPREYGLHKILHLAGRIQRKTAERYDKRRYERRNRIEIMFGGLKNVRRVAPRCDQCPTVFLATLALAATVIYWSGSLNIFYS